MFHASRLLPSCSRRFACRFTSHSYHSWRVDCAVVVAVAAPNLPQLSRKFACSLWSQNCHRRRNPTIQRCSYAWPKVSAGSSPCLWSASSVCRFQAEPRRQNRIPKTPGKPRRLCRRNCRQIFGSERKCSEKDIVIALEIVHWPFDPAIHR